MAILGTRKPEVCLDASCRLSELPAGEPKQKVQTVAATTGMVLAAALVAVPATRAVIPIPAVAIVSAAGGAGLMAILELLRAESRELDQQPGPLALGDLHHRDAHGSLLAG